MGRTKEMADASIKAAAREKSGYKCQRCGMTNEEHRQRFGRQLEVHRDPPGSPYATASLEVVCRPCHGPLPRRARHSRPFVRVESDLAYKLGVIVAIMGGNVSDRISPLLRTNVERWYAEALKVAQERASEEE